ncbi:Shikimate O-hydroxycinnamoyltransferase [Arachis hypogaea]|nr:Shikimate O-hydroxycinnamoyltransferase [Arachis hypogaea]
MFLPKVDYSVDRIDDMPLMAAQFTRLRATASFWDDYLSCCEQKEEPQEIELATVVLKLTKGQVEMLKKKAYHDGDGFGNGSNSSTLSSSRPYTSFEVISGHLWRCICKVKNEGNWGQKTRVCALVNCRNRFKPNLPQSYFGNATFPTVTPTCCFDDIVHKPLGYAVRNVRKAIERMMMSM